MNRSPRTNDPQSEAISEQPEKRCRCFWSAALSRLLPALLALACLLPARAARAESSRFNLHLNPYMIVPPIGGGLNVGFDWQFRRGFALDFTTGGAVIADGSYVTGMFNAALGVRFRFLDSHRGYACEPCGDRAGNLFLIPRLGAAIVEGGGYGTFDVEFGYEWSVKKPLQLGPFIRGGAGFGDAVMGYIMVGLAFSFGVGPEIVRDADRDGVLDNRDLCPNTPCGSVVNERGCVIVGDSDRDGVLDDRDRCPNTPPGSEVDERGCVIIRREMVLRGILFRLNSAEIEPRSEPTLRRAAQALRDNPEARVEIGGHTDDLGTPEHNLQLSQARAQAVADWLTAQGISPQRLVVRGYGHTRPRVANDSEANRELNRRIEFRRIDDPTGGSSSGGPTTDSDQQPSQPAATSDGGERKLRPRAATSGGERRRARRRTGQRQAVGG